MLKMQHDIHNIERITTIVAMVVMLLFFVSCREKDENLVPFSYNPEEVPTMVTDSVTTDRKSTRLNSSHTQKSRMPSSA